MATAPCPRCGGLAPVGATFCPFCGASLQAPLASTPTAAPAAPPPGQYAWTGPPPPPGPPPGYAPGYYGPTEPIMGPPVPTPATRAADRGAMTYLLWAAILWLVSALVSVADLFIPGGLAAITTTSTGTTVSFRWEFYVVVLVGVAFSIVNILLLRTSFRELVPHDRRFSTPSKLALLAVVGVVLVVIGLYPLLLGAQSFLVCASNTTNTTLQAQCPGLGEALAGFGLLAVGGIIALVGYIGCLVGIWRFGSRYGNDLFKIGAILLIFPLLNVVGAILILVGASSVRDRVATSMGGAGPSF